MNIKDFLVKHRISLISREIDLDEAKRLGKEVYHNGILCGYYLEDGFYTYSAYCSLQRGKFKNAFRISNIVSFLNPDISSEVLFEYMDLVCKEYFDTNDSKVDRSIILKNINKVKDGLYEVSPIVSKYFWVKPYTNIGLEDKIVNGVEYAGKKRVVMSQYNKTKKIDTMNSIQNAIDILTSDLHNNGTFITMKAIAEFCDISRSIVDKYYIHFKEEIDRYNLSVFNTTNYGVFTKNCSVERISIAIKRFIEELEIKLTQRGVAKKSGLHFNTVCSLWNEEEVQEALEEYNKWLLTYKKTII
jgi:hypothetical protein